MAIAATELSNILTFHDLIHYLEEKLDWPLRQYGFEELTFEYQPEELGLKEEDAAKVRTIHQLRPLQHDQPWGIFFVEFENKKLPVGVLRRILSHLVIKKRASANKAGEAAWHSEDLMFITTFGEDDNIQREIAFAHFHQSAGDLPTLHVLGWDGGDTPLKLAHLDSDLQQHLRWPENTADHRAWRQQWSSPFRHRIGHIISTASALAEALADLARGINGKAIRMLAVESENGPLRMLYKAFQTALIHDLTEENFADTYAQTITYGLLTAAISRTDWSAGRHGTFVIAENVTDMVPITNPFLREMLQYFLKIGGRKGGIDFDELGIQDVVELLRGDETDLPAILRDFGNRTPGEDPVIHFYEHFLSAYNKKLKIKRGVFYTPKPVVSYIIRSVHELLQTEFGLEDGLASTITWGEMIKRHPEMTLPILTPKNPSLPNSEDILISPESPFVMILDIATGTGTFLVEIIDVIYKTMKVKWQKQGKREQEIVTLWNEYVPKHLLSRLYGYELMMAPYAIAHMKIGLKLSETGYKFMSDERVRVYLTNTLEQASDAQSKLVGILPALAHEAEAVNDVKRSVRFTVLVGNPPYSRHSSNPSKSIEGRLNFIGRLIEKYKEGCPELRKPAQAKYLQDDYVKFMRLSEYSIEEVRVGVVGLITNHGFIDNPTFRGMRNHLLGNFNKVRIIDLHGNANKKERAPDGSEDKNVFDIKQGVSVLIGARLRNIPECEVFHGDLWGSREYKYRALSSTKKDLSTTIIFPKQPQFSLRPRDETNENEYLVFPSIAEIFSPNGSPAPGIVTTQDSFAVAFTKKEIIANVERLLLSKNEAEARQHFRFCTQDQWNYSVAKRELSDGIWRKKIIPLHYRPFDTRFTVYDSNIAVHRRERVTKHLISGGNIAMLTSRMTKGETFKHVQVTRLVPEVICMSPMTSNNGFVFPLWLKADVAQTLQINIVGISENGRRLNLGREFLENLSAILCVKHLSVFGIPAGLTPEDIFNYIYAILHSPTYRKRYAEFLKIDFPRVPLTSNVELFRSLATLGGELVALHLLEAPKVNDFITRFTGKGDNSIPKKPTWEENAVWINPTQRFEGVPENVWNFHIGGYQVCEKWLKDRKGRTLSTDDITHYQRIVVALNETIRIMAEIDQVIDEHGGWPIK